MASSFVSSGPLWPALFLPRHDEDELRSHLILCVVGQDDLPTLFLPMVGAQ
jgi:hypothetical protein